MLIYGFFINSMMAEERTLKIEVSSKDEKEQFCKQNSERKEPCFQTKKWKTGEGGIGKEESARIVTNSSMMEVRC